MEKTLGQTYFDGAYPNDRWDLLHGHTKASYENVAAGQAAVARHVVSEAMAAHVAECHAKSVVSLGTSNSGPIIACEVKSPQPDAGDWAIEAIRKSLKSDEPMADIIRDAAERHYGPMVDALKEAATTAIQERDAARERIKILEAELEQAATRLGKTHPVGECKGIGLREVSLATEQVCDELDAARAEAERLKGDIPSPVDIGKFREHLHGTYSGGHHHDGHYDAFHHGMDTVCNVLDSGHFVYRKPLHPTPPAATGDDELSTKIWWAFSEWETDDYDERRAADVAISAIRPLFDALRRERDEWKEKDACCSTNYKLAIAQGDRDLKRAEAAEAALGELKAATNEFAGSLIYGHQSPTKYRTGDTWYDTPTDAILAAYRANKAASGAAKGVVKS